MSNEISIKVTTDFKKEEYDNFVYNNPNTSIFQTLDMAEVYKINKNTTPFILVAQDEDTGEIYASLLAKILSHKSGFLKSFSTHSTIRGGPLFKGTKDGVVAMSLLLREYNNLIKNYGVLYTRIYPLNDPSEIVIIFEDNGYLIEHWNNFLIDLNKPKKDIWSKITKSKKRGINKAQSSGVKFLEIENEKQIYKFYDLIAQTFKKRKNPIEDISNFEAVYNILVSKNEAKIFFAEYDKKIIGTRLILCYKDSIYAWYTGMDRNYAKYHPSEFLVWRILDWGIDNGYNIFDFGGGGEQNEVGEGWVEFKRRFGGNMVNFGKYTNIHHPKKYWLVSKLFEIYRNIL